MTNILKVTLCSNLLCLVLVACAYNNPPSTAVPVLTLTPVATSVPPSPTEQANELIDSEGVAMIRIPHGEFLMGKDGAGQSGPAHVVYLDEYYIDKYEVTNRQYAVCVKAKICKPPLSYKSRMYNNYYDNAKYADYPMINIQWKHAQHYCEWRKARLPSEAEWEKAARGTDGREYPWGNEKPSCELVNFNKVCGVDPQKVGSYEKGASPYGVLDMGGNVREWTADYLDSKYYKKSPRENPLNTVQSSYRVVRGGSWYFDQSSVQVFNRAGYSSTDYDDNVGFRCVRSQ